ncbi:MAG: glycosyltransferase [Desulfobulbaceae bacterium]|nr:glycosyltransferase [Desulfobulbaceae bacterium]HIJ89328.1 glycosyltransferase [Deltaproteobacteria bacterium]
MKIAEEQELLSLVTHALPSARRVLVLAPHPDDEVFGCGGALCLLREAGVEVSQLVLTDGALGADNTGGGLAVIREQESLAAAQVLGLPGPMFWREPDRGLNYGEPLIERISNAIEAAEADLIFLPAPTELHPDHQALAFAGSEALRRLGGKRQAVFYELNAPLANPNLILDISRVAGKKQQAMRCFRSQLAEQPYDVRIAGLNSYRAFFLGQQAVSAEAFLLAPAAELGEALPMLFAGVPFHRRQQGFAVCGADIPLVSIVVRSMDRQTLTEALDSLALQTWPNIEVVVVNAKGGEHSDLGDRCGRFPLRIVNQGGEGLSRGRAANIGLSACQGEFLGFLDDDDTIDPEHIHYLAVALQKAPGETAAYAGVRGLRREDSQRKEVARFAETEVEFAKLLLGNCIPIHAVLFPSRLLQRGSRFDETLDLYEDWDFWLQIAREIPFNYVERVSATYYTGGDSAVGLGETANPEIMRQAGSALIDKWLAQIRPEEFKAIGDLYHQIRGELHGVHLRLGELQHEISEKNEQIVERDVQIAMLNQAIAERDAYINDLLASTSWRVTQPLRWFGRRMARTRHFSKILSVLLKREGLAVFLAKGITIFRREGFYGIKRRIGSLLSEAAAPSGANGVFDRNDYGEWIRRYDTITDEDRIKLRARMEHFVTRPLISVIMPTYNPNVEWLTEAIESVLKQIYPYWELCIADDASTDPAIRSLLERYAEKDPRIKVVFRPVNGHISLASNSALELATGEWIALVDHDDVLCEHALFYVAEAINNHSDARLIYSDEDKLDDKGNRFAPYFKCDWNRDLFYSHNMITHLGVYRADLVRELGGFRLGAEGAQDYDLALRCIEQITDTQILHIPKVLYHWRMHQDSTALSAEAKPYAMLAGERVLNEHLVRQGIAARAELIGHGFRVRYALPEKLPLVSLIIPTRNGLKFIRQCVESILAKTTYPHYEIIILDNASNDPETLAYFRQIEQEDRVKVVRDERPFNYSALNNAGVRLASGEVVGLLNNDLEVISPDWLSEMVSLAMQPGVGAVGARLLYPDNTVQHGGIILGIGGWAGHAHKGFPRGALGYSARASLIQGFSAITGACLLIRKDTYEKFGGLNEAELQIACNDVDLCLRLCEAGLRNVWTPYAELYHHESATRGYEDTPEKKARFMRELAFVKKHWPELFRSDPAYNPNLTLDHEDFSLAWPPRLDC